MGDEEIDYNRVNNDWQNHLERFWKDNFSINGSKFQTIIDKIGLSITPIAILPFEKYLYAKYIALPDEHQELSKDEYKLLITEKRPVDTEIDTSRTPIAPGMYKAICLDAPYMWIKYLKEQEEYRTFPDAKKEIQDIDNRVYDLERSLYTYLMQTSTYCANCGKSSIVSNALSKVRSPDYSSVKGHFIVPLFYGIIPVYCVIVTSNVLNPDIFKIYYLRETLDMIGRAGEYILEEKLFESWISFCEKYTNNYEPCSETRKTFFNTLIKMLTGKECKRKFSSWIHTIPGHWIEQNERLKSITTKFENEYEIVKERLVRGDEWYKEYFSKLIRISNEIKLFSKPHEIKRQPDLALFKDKIKSNSVAQLVSEANKCQWFKDIISKELHSSDFKVARFAFYKLKSILNRVNYERQTISGGLIAFWPMICDDEKTFSLEIPTKIEFLKSEVIIVNNNPFEFTKLFYNFVKAFNKDDVKINKISFDSGEEQGSNWIKMICKTTQAIPEKIIRLLCSENLWNNIENDKGNRHEVSYNLVLLLKARTKITVSKNKKKFVFKLGGLHDQ